MVFAEKANKTELSSYPERIKKLLAKANGSKNERQQAVEKIQ